MKFLQTEDGAPVLAFAGETSADVAIGVVSLEIIKAPAGALTGTVRACRTCPDGRDVDATSHRHDVFSGSAIMGVYFIRDQQHRVKIGVTRAKDARERLATIQTGNVAERIVLASPAQRYHLDTDIRTLVGRFDLRLLVELRLGVGRWKRRFAPDARLQLDRWRPFTEYAIGIVETIASNGSEVQDHGVR